MRQNIEEARETLKFDPLMKFLDQQFQQIPDHRAKNTSYPLAEVLKAAFAMFSLKSPSLLAFTTRTTAEINNLKTIYRIAGQMVSDTQMRVILDRVEPSQLRGLLGQVSGLLEAAGVLNEYRFGKSKVLLSIDGVEHFSSQKVHCPNCTTKTLRNGETCYQHSGLGAVLVHPEKREVFPLDFEAVIKQDGERKNDCERNGAKRLCERIKEQFPEQEFILVEDALYANAPHLEQISGYGWSYILNIKPDSHKSLFRQFEESRERGAVETRRTVDEEGTEHLYKWTSGLSLCDSAAEIKVNLLMFEERRPDGQVKRWTWVTDLPLNQKTVAKVMAGARARWKIENETFNTLKNQGYHFEHNYGHGEKNLATNLALLMMLAFLIDQIQQGCDRLFEQVWQGLRTKSKLWSAVRSCFQIIELPSMEELYRRIAGLYRIRVE